MGVRSESGRGGRTDVGQWKGKQSNYTFSVYFAFIEDSRKGADCERVDLGNRMKSARNKYPCRMYALNRLS